MHVITVERVNEPKVASQLLALDAQLGVVLAFGQKIGPDILGGLPGGCINAHGSLLPKYRGAAPVQWTVINGDESSGVTVFKLVKRMDAGPILSSRWTSLKDAETAEELHDRLAGIAVDAVNGALELYAADPNPPGTPQDESAATSAPKLKKEDGLIDFGKTAAELAHFICGMWSWPGARCRFTSADGSKHEEAVLARARVFIGAVENLPPGQIDARMLVATRDGMLEILEIKPAGGRLMSWPDYVNGRHVQSGDCFQTLLHLD